MNCEHVQGTSRSYRFYRPLRQALFAKEITMIGKVFGLLAFLLLILLSNGCQVNNAGTETRTEEQMLDISYENAKAEEVFN